MINLQNPFPGLRPFEAHESHLFFGRERHIGEITRKLAEHRFVSVVGNSGSGKSSLVRAGVLPELAKNEAWLIEIMRPGENPLANLDQLLKSIGSSTPDSYEILSKNRLGLVQQVRHVLPEGKKLLILVDQFEEIFRFDADGVQDHNAIANQFIELLLSGVGQSDVPIYIMLTLRSDFLGDCEQFMGLPEAINDGQFLVPRMNREDLQRSLTGPIHYAGAKISPRLVQLLLDEVGNSPDQLPILQHVLMRTWEVWESENNPALPLDIDHYNQTGGMKQALSNHAEEAFSTLSGERQRTIAEHLFKTITVKGADNRGIRRPTPLAEIAGIAKCSEEEVKQVAEIFRHPHQGFIMPPQSVEVNSESMLDISHESLMRVWGRLRTWVEEEAESAELYSRITDSANLYEQNKAGLWRDPDLQIALDWKAKNSPNEAWARQYNENFKSSIRFIEASLNEKKFLYAERVRRRRILNYSAIAVVVVLAFLSIWAISERNSSIANAMAARLEKTEAEKQRKIAEQQKNLAESNFQEAEESKREVLKQQSLTEQQRNIALAKAEEARKARERAEIESENAKKSKQVAENERDNAERQRQLSDSLKVQAEKSEQQAKRLRLLSLAQNLAIKSKLADQHTLTQQLKTLLALQAFNFHKRYQGNKYDPEIFGALFSSLRRYQPPAAYMHEEHSNMVNSVCYSSSGVLASAGDDGMLVLVNSKGEIRKSAQLPYILDNLVFHPSGDRFALSSASDQTMLRVFKVNDLDKPLVDLNDVTTSKIMAIEWYADNLIIACLDEKKVKIVDTRDGKVTATYAVPSRPYSLDFHEGKKLLLIGCEDGSLYKLKIGEDKEISLFKKVSGSTLLCISLNSSGAMVATGTMVGTCQVFKVSDGSTVASLSGHNGNIKHVRFNKEDHLATACLDSKVRLYTSLADGSQPIEFAEHSSWANDVIFHPNKNMLASCSRDKTVRYYPTSSEEIAQELKVFVNRNFTKEEWERYIGDDVPYEKTIDNVQ